MIIIHIAGHLGADPEVRFTSSGQKVTTLRVAAKARKGSAEDNTVWWKVTIWGEQFDKMLPFFKKGSSIMVMGEFNKPEIFMNKEGNPQISMSMTASNLMFSPFGRTDRSQENTQSGFAKTEEKPSAENHAGFVSGQNPLSNNDEAFTDDEIPF